MRPDHSRPARVAAIAVTLLLAISRVAASQSADGPVIRARALDPKASIKMFVTAGSIRIVGWDRDSIVVHGSVAAGEKFYFSGDAQVLKLGIQDHRDDLAPRPSTLVMYVPRGSTLSIKAVSADIIASDVSGWFYSVSGAIRLSGSSTSVEAEALSGNITLDVLAPWIRARTGAGSLLVRGAPQDADVSTISGALDIASPGILRGRFTSVSGDIRYAGTLPPGGIFEFSNHGGTVDLLLPAAVAGVFDLTSVSGDIQNGLTQLRPAAAAGGRGQSLRLNLGRDGSRVTVRTFKGTIRLRPR